MDRGMDGGMDGGLELKKHILVTAVSSFLLDSFVI